MSFEFIIKCIIVVAIILNLFCVISCLTRRQRSGQVLFFVGFILSVVIFGMNFYHAGEPPFGNMYHVMIFLSMSFFPLFLYLNYYRRVDGLLGFFAFSAMIALIGTLFMKVDIAWQRAAVLQSYYFVPHVSSYILSYSLCAIAFALTVASYLKKEYCLQYENSCYEVMVLAFPFMNFGLLSGMLWADQAWGMYWSWDIKESWSLITVLLYALYFHCRLDMNLKKYQRGLIIVAFVALLITFLVVNLLPKLDSLHSYA